MTKNKRVNSACSVTVVHSEIMIDSVPVPTPTLLLLFFFFSHLRPRRHADISGNAHARRSCLSFPTRTAPISLEEAAHLLIWLLLNVVLSLTLSI